jgi:hypothetical protein
MYTIYLYRYSKVLAKCLNIFEYCTYTYNARAILVGIMYWHFYYYWPLVTGVRVTQ